jgi:hypothetical protein
MAARPDETAHPRSMPTRTPRPAGPGLNARPRGTAPNTGQTATPPASAPRLPLPVGCQSQPITIFLNKTFTT